MLQHAYFDCAAETGAWAQAYTDEAKYLYHAWFKLVSRAQLDIEAQLTRNAREFLRFDLSLFNACCRHFKVSSSITSRKLLLKTEGWPFSLHAPSQYLCPRTLP